MKTAIIVLADTETRESLGRVEQISNNDVPFADEHDGHLSIRQLVQDGYQIITF